MAQSFITTYKNSYRWHSGTKRPDACVPQYEFAEHLIFEDDPWLLEEDLKEGRNAEEELKYAEQLIKKIYKKRMVSTYQLHYCKADKVVSQASGTDQGAGFENELMEYCRNLYEPEKLPKVLKPLPSARKVFGYLRPARFRTPTTNYQYNIGLTGYNVLKGEARPIQPSGAKTDLVSSKPHGEGVQPTVTTKENKTTKITNQQCCCCCDET